MLALKTSVVNWKTSLLTLNLALAIIGASGLPSEKTSLLRNRESELNNLIIDGGFESYQPGVTGFSSYTTTGQANWIGESENGGVDDGGFFNYPEFAFNGSSAVALLGSATARDANAGSISPRLPLSTSAGTAYKLAFYAKGTAGKPVVSGKAFFEVYWNGALVPNSRVEIGYDDPGREWTLYEFQLPPAIGGDVLKIRGGNYRAYTYIDDISLVEAL